MVLKVRQIHFFKAKVCKVKYVNQKAKQNVFLNPLFL